MLRVVAGLAVLALLLLLALKPDRPPSPIWALANSLLGQRWYQLDLDATAAGSLQSTSWLDNEGDLHFRSELRFAFDDNGRQVSSDELIFHGRPPHELRQAIHHQEFNDGVVMLTQKAGKGHYLVSIQNAQHHETQELNFRFTLADYLALESWISQEQPPVDAELTVTRLDFDNPGLTPSRFRVLRAGAAYVLENSAPHSEFQITLDTDLSPLQMRLGGVLKLTRVDQPRTLMQSSRARLDTHHIPLDRQLPDHQNLRRLRLAVEGADAYVLTSPLELAANPLAPRSELVDWKSSTLELPLHDPALRALASPAPTRAELISSGPGVPGDSLRDLVNFVHDSLGYVADLPDRPLSAVLKQRTGDCTDYANLFTGLARLRGWPARTVFGLAYAENPAPGFAFHAWNEVNLEGRWQSVDPTWNQIRVDATHIPLAAESTLSLRLASGQADIRFRVLDYAHFDQ